MAKDHSKPPASEDEIHIEPASFIDAGKLAGSIEVELSYGIIDRFSEGLYSSPNKAFEELVSNAYDAGAKNVWVEIPNDLQEQGATLAVIDDGHSMDLSELRALWQIGVSPKRDIDSPDPQRDPIGKFGIGKPATYVLANKLTYICLKNGEYLGVTMDFSLVRGRGKSLTHTTPMILEVRKLSKQEAEAALRKTIVDSALVDHLFAEGVHLIGQQRS